MGLRIALGPCKCGTPPRDAIEEMACRILEARLEHWRARLPADLRALPAEHLEHERIDGHWMTLVTLKMALNDDRTIVVFGALVRTLRWPTYFTAGAIGRYYAEGLLLSGDGVVERAPDEVMWEFR